MNQILSLKCQLQELYANYSRIIDKVARFALALVCFLAINKNIGFMHALTNPIIAVGLSVASAFLPTAFIALFAAGMVLVHVYTISIVVAIIVGITFFLMFIFYIRFAPKTAVAVLIMPIAFMLKIPVVIPVVVALMFNPIYAVSVALGTMSYYMLRVVEKAGNDVASADGEGMISAIMSLIKHIFQNKEMWIAMVAAVACVFVVYGVRKVAIPHAWKLASVAGSLTYVIIMKVGGSIFGVDLAMGSAVMGIVLAIVIGLVLEVIFFSVDYKKCESLEYEDDEYYYYVKAVPKVGISASTSSENAKRRKDYYKDEAEVIDVEELPTKSKNRRLNGKQLPNRKGLAQQGRKQSATNRKTPVSRPNDLDDADQLLLTQSLRKDLNLED